MATWDLRERDEPDLGGPAARRERVRARRAGDGALAAGGPAACRGRASFASSARSRRWCSSAPNIVTFGEVVGVHLDERRIVDGRVDTARLKPIARCGYRGDYAVVELFEMIGSRPLKPVRWSLRLQCGCIALMFVEAVGGVLVVREPRVCGLGHLGSPLASRRVFAAALAAAAADAFGAGSALPRRRLRAWRSRARLVMVLERLGKPLPMTWLDFVMGGCAVGALSATTGAELGATLGASGVAAALGLARWRVSARARGRAGRADRARRAAVARGRPAGGRRVGARAARDAVARVQPGRARRDARLRRRRR